MPEQHEDRVEVYVDDKGEHRWRYKAGNGRIMAASGEGYANEIDMLAAIEQVTGRALTETKGQQRRWGPVGKVLLLRVDS
jgi:uncharacterized protein YegP (UPF0339 family)